MSSTMTVTGVYWENRVAFMLTVEQEGSPLIEINGGNDIWTMAYTANGEYIGSGDADGIRLWRVEDGGRDIRA